MESWIVLVGLVAVVAGIPLAVATLRPPVRGGLLLGYLGMIQVVPGVVVAPYSIPLGGDLAITPASVLVAGVLFTVTLLVVVERDAVLVRLAALVVLIAGALEVLLVATTGWALSSGVVTTLAGADATSYGIGLHVVVAGTPVVIAEVLLAVVVSERLRRDLPRRFSAAVAGVVTLAVLCAVDGVAFTLATRLLEPGLAGAVAGGVARKLVLAGLFGVPLVLFLGWYRPREGADAPLRLRDVLTLARRDLVERVARHEGERLQLLERAMTVAEEERDRLAGNLHDDAIQLFTAADLHLQRLRSDASGSDVATVHRLVRDGMGSLRRVVLELSGPEVTPESFAPLVRTYVRRLQPQGGVEVEVDVDLPSTVPADVVAAAYRIVVEALSNVVKHADADRAAVTVAVRCGVLHGTVTDDGIGIPPDASTGPGHLGLRAMADRAAMLGGVLEVRASDGTCVSFSLPVPRETVMRSGGQLVARGR